jgi:hypothetical protein
LVALGISALGKKRHRVEIARQLVVGSLVGNFEKHKDILYPADDTTGKALLRVLDSSLPWWTERDTWGRWTTKRAVKKDVLASNEHVFPGRSSQFQLASSDGRYDHTDVESKATLFQIIQQLAGGQDHTSKRQFRINAM